MSTLSTMISRRPYGKKAIIIPQGPSISYEQLEEEVERVSRILTGCGIQPGTAVSIVLGNGLEFMVAFLAVVRAGGIAAPLNPAYTIQEFKFYMEDASAQLVVTSEDADFAVSAASQLSIQTVVTSITADNHVSISRNGSELTQAIYSPPPLPEDVALFLHTSGTTSRPKGVPLTHKNLIASLSNIVRTYSLTPYDIALVVMPLFHVHGLIGVALSTLNSGGTIVIPPRFSAGSFWQHQADTNATWYSAVPTIHQILLTRAEGDSAPRQSFRFIRSCSAALPTTIFDNLEDRFGAPVLEAYGMTEASHQMASNRLPPEVRLPGTVGNGTGVQIAIMDESGTILHNNKQGEVVISGPNVTLGYHNNPQANTKAFVNGWFRTGDQGILSSNNVLTLTGRIKELINRGGEKISPVEVDAALIQHSAVAEAVCFGVKDEKYGEIVQAAVVLSAEATESDILSFCTNHLAKFKMPDRIYIVEELPRTATGKIQRRHVASMFSKSKGNPHES